MAQITLTLDFTPETVNALKLLADALNGAAATTVTDKVEVKKDTKKTTSKDKKPADEPKTETEAAEPEQKAEAPKYSMTDVRAVALKLSKAGKQAKLKEIFAKYGAEKLSDISEDNYGDLMADLEAANG